LVHDLIRILGLRSGTDDLKIVKAIARIDKTGSLDGKK